METNHPKQVREEPKKELKIENEAFECDVCGRKCATRVHFYTHFINRHVSLKNKLFKYIVQVSYLFLYDRDFPDVVMFVERHLRHGEASRNIL